MFDTFLRHIKALVPDIPEEDTTAILRAIKVKEYARKTILWSQGSRVREIGYVYKGCFRYSTISESGLERTTMFAMEDYWIGDMNSVLNDEPAKQSLEALEDAILLCMSKSDYKWLLENCTSFRQFTNLKRIRAYDASITRVMDMTESAETRYAHFLEKYPNAVMRIPLYHIASYLGITPESLSRVRKKIATGPAK